MHITQIALERFSTLGLITLYKPLAKNLNYGIIIMYPIEVQENNWKFNDNERGNYYEQKILCTRNSKHE